MSAPLVKAAAKTAGIVDTLGQQFAEELRQVLRALERKLRGVVDEATQGKPTAIVRAVQANKARKGIQGALTASGYPELAETAYGPRLDQLTAAVLTGRKLARASSALAAGAEGKLEALRLLGQRDLLHAGDDAAYRLWQATVRGVFGARSADDILHDLAGLIDLTEPRLRTLYDTSLSIYGRQVEALQAGDNPEATFAYMGPVDRKTREFCLQHAGKVYTRDQIDALDNGQIDNVFLTGGGYNCRHIWMEVSRFSELRDFVDTPQRVPEVEEQLGELKEAA